MAFRLLGWADAWTSPYEQTTLTEERRRLLVECIRYRHYNFTYQSHQTLPFAAPFYSDEKICVLTKPEWDSVISEAYGDNPLGQRLMPADAITSAPKNGVLFEKNKNIHMGENNNG